MTDRRPGARPALLGAPAGYYGLTTIALRMGVTRNTVRAWQRAYAFPIYKRRLPASLNPWRWYTNDAMILAWELARAAADRAVLLERHGLRSPAAGPPPKLDPDTLADLHCLVGARGSRDRDRI